MTNPWASGDSRAVPTTNPMNARCGLEDCDCGYTIEKLVASLELAASYLDHPDVKAMPFALPSEAVANRARAAIEKAKGGQVT